MQSESVGDFVDCRALQSAAATAGRIARDANPHEANLYLSAHVGHLFLASETGRRELELADVACEALWLAALNKHQDSPAGERLEYGWAMIKALHPNGPGPLSYWGRPEHLPDAVTAEQSAPRPP